MKIAVLKEPTFENRVALLPEAVKTLTGAGNTVYLEQGAGESASCNDALYLEVGAQIVQRDQALVNAEMVLAIHPLDEGELKLIAKNGILFGMYQPLVNATMMEKIASLGLTLFSLDTIPRITRAQSMDVLSSMSTVAGYKAVLLGASHLPRFFPMLMTAAGTITPSKVLILGAGVAGLQAIATAKRLGAVVEAFDTRGSVKEQVMSLGGKFIEVEGAVEDKAAGGYAVEQSDDFKKKQAEIIHQAAIKADIVITTALIPGKKAPVLIEENTVQQMKPGSVIVDLAAGAGGNCPLTQNNAITQAYGVTLIGDSNLASTMPQDASKMFGKNILNFLKLILNGADLNLNFNDEIVAGTCITHQNQIVYKPLIK